MQKVRGIFLNKSDKEQLLKVAKMNQKKSEEVAAKTKKQKNK